MTLRRDSAFTVTSNFGLLNILASPCTIADATEAPGEGGRSFTAIWDTGATNSVITQAVVDACGLVATGIERVYNVTGSAIQESHLVTIELPNRSRYTPVRVTKGNLQGEADVLIGMDIINTGDFAVTNFGGVTRFSFRFPSLEHIDFVERVEPDV